MTKKSIKKPSPKVAAQVFLLFALLALTGILVGIFTSDMRPVMAVIYLAFGFGLQRAGFCSASLISGAVLSRDRKGLVAIGIAVLTALLGIGLLNAAGFATHSTGQGCLSTEIQPTNALAMGAGFGSVAVLTSVMGGLALGIGMVLAGGCISGSLFKATEGRFPSILAVSGILIGIVFGTSGTGSRFRVFLTDNSPDLNLSTNLASFIDVPFSILAPAISVCGLLLLGLMYRQQFRRAFMRRSYPLDRRWPLFGVALLIGVLGCAAMWAGPPLGRDYPLGAGLIPWSILSPIVAGEFSPIGALAWTFLLGSALSAWMRGDIRWRSAPRPTLILAFVGGCLVGWGMTIASGCFVGQVLSGWALLLTHSLIFGLVMVLSNWVTTFFYLRGIN